MDECRGLQKIVSRFEGRVALAYDEHALVCKIMRVDRDVNVTLDQFYTRNRRHVGFVKPCGHDQTRSAILVAILIEHAELKAHLGYGDNSRGIANLECVARGEII